VRPARIRHASFHSLVHEITTAARFGDESELRQVVRAAAENIPTARDLVEGVLAPAARDVGVLWETGCIDRMAAGAAVSTLGHAIPDRRLAHAHPARHRAAIVFACPVGEWHELPARMSAAVLREEGDWDVTTLGPSLDTKSLSNYVRERRPLAVLLTCTVAANLGRAADMIAAVHKAGTPVIAGGAAFDGRSHRARAIGADMWCADTFELATALHAWERHPPSVARRATPQSADALTGEHRARVIDAAMRTLTRPNATSGAHPALTERSASRLSGLLALLEAAVLVNDESILGDGLDWWRRRMRALQVSGDAFLDPALDALSAALEPGPFRSFLLRARFDGVASPSEERQPVAQEFARFTSNGR
jgi:methanogenic corrinoid protein MtbC1